MSEGCRHCYAERVAARFNGPGQPYEGLARKVGGEARWTNEVRLVETALDQPLRWRRPRRIFVNSMSDLFHEALPDAAIDRIFAVMALAPQHQFLVLTKRPERMNAYMLERWQGTPAQTFHGLRIPAGGPTGRRGQVEEACQPIVDRLRLCDPAKESHWTADEQCKAMQWGWPLPNVWLGVSIEDQVTADARIPLLLEAPAAVRFVSVEPLLGPVDLTSLPATPAVYPYPHQLGDQIECFRHMDALRGVIGWVGQSLRPTEAPHEDGLPRLNWVIAGGESGPGARPMHPAWPRQLRDQCAEAGVPFFFKQWGDVWPEPEAYLGPDRRRLEVTGGTTRKLPALLDGVEHHAWPEPVDA